jgi:MYXO-CTERM domain-containing protein
MMRASFFAGALACSAVAYGEITVTSSAGAIDLNGSPYAGEPINFNDRLTLSADPGSESSVSFQPKFIEDADSSRTVMRFSGTGSSEATFTVPADYVGATQTITAGQAVTWTTWNPWSFPQSHQFSASVANGAAADDPASLDIEFKQAPRPTASPYEGAFVPPTLDNMSFDQDPAVGSIRLDRTITPTITVPVQIRGFRFDRAGVEWEDETITGSPHRDGNFTGAWILFTTVEPGDNEPIFTGERGLDTVPFEIGEIGFRLISTGTVDVTIDLTNVADGDFEMKVWEIPWFTDYYLTEQGFGSFGFVENEAVISVTVVPEPTGLVLAAAGAAVLLRRRRRGVAA